MIYVIPWPLGGGIYTEGDQLYMDVKQTVEGAQKMTFDPARMRSLSATSPIWQPSGSTTTTR